MNTKTLSEQTVNENSLSQYKKEVLAEFCSKYKELFFPYGGDYHDFNREACEEFISKALDNQIEKIREEMPKKIETNCATCGQSIPVERVHGENVDGWNNHYDEMLRILNS